MMKKIFLLFSLIAAMSSCEVADRIDVSVRRKAIVHFIYHYDNGRVETLDGVESMRIFIYDDLTGRLYRDTTLLPDAFLCDTGAMQTYISNGRYSIFSWANVGSRTAVRQGLRNASSLVMADAGADPLMYGRVDTPVQKGDSLSFDIWLFKSVFKVNVRVSGLEKTENPEEYYFAFQNRAELTIDNHPTGDILRYRPQLVYANNILAGSFYTPYFSPEDDFTLGIYRDTDEAAGLILCQTSVRSVAEFLTSDIGHDVEINIDIRIDDSAIRIVISDWAGQIIQDVSTGK